MLGFEAWVMAGMVELAAASGGCTRPPNPRVTMSVSAPRPRVDQSRTQAELSRVALTGGAAVAGARTGGLTAANISTEFRYEIQATGDPTGRTGCVWISKIAIELKVVQQVYIAREYLPGTCNYRVLLEHENRHVASNQEIARFHAPQIERDFARVAQQIGALRYTNGRAATAQAQVEQQLTNTLQAINQRMTRDRDRMVLAIDTPAEYARITNACAGWR